MRIELITITVEYPGITPNQLQDKLAAALTHIEDEGYELAALAYMGVREMNSGREDYSYTAAFRKK